MKKRVPKRPSKGRGRKSAARAPQAKLKLRSKWKSLDDPLHATRPTLRRFYKPETLASAVDAMIEQKFSFIGKEIVAALGPAPLTATSFELQMETQYSFVFNARLTNAKRARATLRLVVAKNAEEHTRTLKEEFAGLTHLAKLVPRCVAQPLHCGNIFLPDRHRRKSGEREIFSYLTETVGSFRPLTSNTQGRMALASSPPRILTKKQITEVQRRLIEIVIRSYDPKTKQRIRIPDLTSGHILANFPKDRPCQLKITGCPGLIRKSVPASTLNDILTTTWSTARNHLNVAPDDPDEIMQALTNALGKNHALYWLSQYRRSVTSKRHAESGLLPLDYVNSLLESNTPG